MSAKLPPIDMGSFLRTLTINVDRIERMVGQQLGRDKVVPSDQRPDPLDRAGARVFDLGLGKPIWSNGTVWVDATGTPV